MKAKLAGALAGMRPWTPQEDALLRAEYKRGNAAALAAKLGRSSHAVWQRARRLGAQVGRHWTDEDNQRLAALWGEFSLRQLAARLNRTTDATYVQAVNLGLTKEERARTEDLNHAARRTGFCRDKLRKILEAHGVARLLPVRPTTKYKLRPAYRLDPFEVDEAIAAHLSTETPAAVARRIGISHHVMERAIGRIGVAKPLGKRRHWRVDEQTIERAIAALKDKRPAVRRAA